MNLPDSPRPYFQCAIAPDAFARIATALAYFPAGHPVKLDALAALNELMAWRTAAIARHELEHPRV